MKARLLLLRWLPLAFSLSASAVANPFAQRLDAETYDAAMAGLPQDRINVRTAVDAALPTWGVGIVSVVPNSQATKQGLEAGWIIDRCNGKEYWDHRLGLKPDAEGRRRVSIVSPAGVPRDFEFEPGTIGINTSNSYLPEQFLIQEVARGPWDRDLLVTSVAWQFNQFDLAETALHHAIEAGLPDAALVPFFESVFAHRHGDDARARERLDTFRRHFDHDDEIPRFYLPGIRAFALAQGDFELLGVALAEMNPIGPAVKPPTALKWKAWADAADRISPHTRAARRAGEDLIPNIIPEVHGEEFEILDPARLRDGNHAVSIPPGHYDHRFFTVEGDERDFIWEMDVAFGETGEPGHYFNQFRAAIMDNDALEAIKTYSMTSEQEMAATLVAFSYGQDGNDAFVRVIAGGSEEYLDIRRHVPVLTESGVKMIQNAVKNGRPPVPPPSPPTFRLTLILSGQEVQVLIDGRSMFHLPIPENDNRRSFRLKQTGFASAINGMTLRPLGADGG